jgi:hypothetical protein
MVLGDIHDNLVIQCAVVAGLAARSGVETRVLQDDAHSTLVALYGAHNLGIEFCAIGIVIIEVFGHCSFLGSAARIIALQMKSVNRSAAARERSFRWG